jgi:prepilin-type N-terminal cleavage/methylation domain-containing protein
MPGLRHSSRGFTLTELAVVLTIVALLLSSMLYTLSAQTEQRDFEQTRQRLEQARDLILAYAMVTGRLPCPARSTSAGAEVRETATGKCTDGTNEDYYGGTVGGATGGLLPAATIGFQPVDSSGFAVDAWQNRIRYTVAKSLTNCSGTSTSPHFTNATNMRANGISCQPNDLIICKSATGITSSACGGAANQINSQSLVVAIVFSTGKNQTASTGGTGLDEAANLNGGGNADPVFVYHAPTPSDAANGEFDDQFMWITVGELYGKLVSAGVLP